MHLSKLLRPGWLILALLVISGCGSQGIQLQENTLLRYLEEQSGRIAYQGMDGNLYTMNQAGEEVTQLTDDAEGLPKELVFGLRHFAWSPDSDQIAYIGFTPEKWTVEVIDPLGETESRQLAEENRSAPIFLNWSPDGKKIGYLTVSDPGNGQTTHALNTALASGDGTPALWAEGTEFYYSWEPSGGRALAHIGGAYEMNDQARITVLSPNSEFERDLGLPPSQFQAPAWSPDGTELLMAIRDVQGRNALVTANMQGQVRQTITTFDRSVAFTWSPDSRYVGYILSDRAREGAVGALTIYDTVTRDVVFTTEEQTVHAFFWSPNGEEIAFFTFSLVNDEEQGQLIAGMRLHILNLKDREVRHLQFGQDAYDIQPTTVFMRFLAHFDQYTQNATIWSPNGEYLVLPVAAESQGVIIAIAASGGIQPRVLSEGMMALWSWK